MIINCTVTRNDLSQTCLENQFPAQSQRRQQLISDKICHLRKLTVFTKRNSNVQRLLGGKKCNSCNFLT